jgi:GNAT superfamily N-acetyltransferase
VVTVRRSETDEDAQRSLVVYNAVWPDEAVTMAEVRSFEAQALAHIDHLAFVDGAAVGSGFAVVQPARPTVALLLLTVLADHRRRGAGSALLQATFEWARSQGATAIEARAQEDDAESLAWAARRGFEEIERTGRMILELARLTPRPVAPPPGITVVSWAERPDLARGMYDVYVEATPDIPGGENDEIEPFEDWLAHHMTGSGDRREATFVAVTNGDEVVGFAKFSLNGAQPDVAFHDLTGVKRAWRGRGVAGALKRAQIAWAKEQGYARLRTSNELRNEPIRRLNAQLGYRPAPGEVLLRLPLAAVDEA